MHIVVKANENQKEEFLTQLIISDDTVKISWQEDKLIEGDVYFDLMFEDAGPTFNEVTTQPVFVNAVTALCKTLPSNCIRINGWPGFLKRDILEITCTPEMNQIAVNTLNTLNRKFIFAPDEPGMIAARIIAMIINEAYFGLGDKISSKQEIDTAMKFGTNYPLGPFEWSEKIGLEKVYHLLKALSIYNTSYTPAPAMEEEILKNKK
ncbi:3-hydroxyacyl-CoA dehydrogenase family protein [Chitinophagaceae bacterium LWZ2-11]